MQNNRQQARQSGFAMILVLCIGALFVALATALLYASSLLVAHANRQLTEQEVYGLAATFSERLNTDLTTYDKQDAAQKNSFGDWVDRYLHDSYYAQAFEPITFDCTNTDLSNLGGVDELSVTMSKSEEDMPDIGSEEVVVFEDAIPPQTTMQTTEDDLSAKEYTDYRLDVSVTAKKKGQSFTYSQSYNAQFGIQYYYTIQGKTGNFAYSVAKERFVSTTGSGEVTPADAKAAGVTIHRVPTNRISVTFVNRMDEDDEGSGGGEDTSP